jgi:predicted homoserine dehydrogenase-like protein
MSTMRYLPEGLVEGCKMKRAVAKDEVLTYDAVELPAGRLADRLRAEQYRHFGNATWLEEHLQRTQGAESTQTAALA